MDWKMQLSISIVAPIVSSIVTYLIAVKQSKASIQAVKIKADNEIEKIKEEYKNQIEKMKIETEEQIKLKISERDLASKENNEKMTNEMAANFLGDFIKDPKKGETSLKLLMDLANQFGVSKDNK